MKGLRLPADRVMMWKFGGLATVALILVAGWLLLLQPHHENAVRARDAAATARAAEAVELTKLKALRADFERAAEYDDQLAANRQALPGTDAVPDFLRELQDAGDASGVTVTEVGVGTPVGVTANGAVLGAGEASGDASMYAIVVTLQATGDAATDAEFLRQLQLVQPRAVLIDTLTLAADAAVVAGDAPVVTLSASLRVFVDAASVEPAPR